MFELTMWNASFTDFFKSSDTIPLLGNNYYLQIKETGFAKQLKALTGWACANLFENFRKPVE